MYLQRLIRQNVIIICFNNIVDSFHVCNSSSSSTMLWLFVLGFCVCDPVIEAHVHKKAYLGTTYRLLCHYFHMHSDKKEKEAVYNVYCSVLGLLTHWESFLHVNERIHIVPHNKLFPYSTFCMLPCRHSCKDRQRLLCPVSTSLHVA